jgi:hypothetical protein
MDSSGQHRAPAFGIVAVFAALGALLMLVVALACVQIIFWPGHLDPGHAFLAWRHEILYLVSKVTGPHELTVLFAWAIFVGTIIAIGAGIREQRLRPMFLMTAPLVGAIVALGLVLFALALGGLLPRTNGLDPVLSALLLAYTLVVPWALGKAMTAFPWVGR